MILQEQLDKIRTQNGFIAALDQSGGSTPAALARYGIAENAYMDDDEMYDCVHAMRSRIITSPVFNGERILGAILFENTMDRDIAGQPTAAYLWGEKRIVPFLKVDHGLAPAADGVQCMRPIPRLDTLLVHGRVKGIFGTKARSLIHDANADGIAAVVEQQFTLAEQILQHDLVPIVEPEVSIHSPRKAEAEALLRAILLSHLDRLPAPHSVMLKLTLPEEDDFYSDLMAHPRVVRVVALSGGYDRTDANARLARNHGMIASFSRALTEGLTAQQSEAEFNRTLDDAIAHIYKASIT